MITWNNSARQNFSYFVGLHFTYLISGKEEEILPVSPDSVVSETERNI
jgi:hypothetical protein